MSAAVKEDTVVSCRSETNDVARQQETVEDGTPVTIKSGRRSKGIGRRILLGNEKLLLLKQSYYKERS